MLSLRACIDDVFKAAEFLEYDANEQQLVDRGNEISPGVLAQSARLNVRLMRLSSLTSIRFVRLSTGVLAYIKNF